MDRLDRQTGEMWGAEDAVLEPVFCDDGSARQNKATQRTSTCPGARRHQSPSQPTRQPDRLMYRSHWFFFGFAFHRDRQSIVRV
jgi:hypothetical protein